PQCIDHYTIIRLLNENPICYTYLGKDEQRKKRYVIIKIFKFPLSTKVARESFLTYAKQLKKLRRNNITEILNFGIISEPGKLQDLGYHVNEYIQDTANTEQYTGGNLFAPDQIKPFLSTIADTLQYAHVSHVMHGNLHPGNILFGEELRITDFSPMPQEFLQTFNQYTTRGLVYKAPEHLHGILTPASDQYSLAVIVYEWLCGQRPYSASNHDELLYQQEHEPIPSPRSINDKISPNVEIVILKALSPEPADRFEHMLKFSDAYLRALMGFPLNDKKNVIGKQSIQPSRPRPAQQTKKSLEDSVKYAEETPQQPEKIGEELSNIHPSSESIIELQADTVKKDELVSSNTESTNDDVVVANENNVHEKKTLTEKPSKKKLSRKPFVNDFSHLNQIVSTDLGHGGILSERLQGYEERPAQIEMASLVARALMEEQHAIVEAATGTGKSLAYLLPIVRSGKIAIISTANKALQEQLFYKDIPFVKEHIDDFDAALVKGMGNYICLDRLDKERIETQPLLKNPDFTRLMNIVQEFELNITGDFETLGFTLPNDIRVRVNADSDQCAWRECPFFSKCYVRQMRDTAAQSQVIVVNHTLLLLDVALDGSLLPKHDVIVIDEAHHLEDEATRAFTVTVSESKISALLAQQRLKLHSRADLQEDAKQTMKFAWDRLDYIMHASPHTGRVILQEPLQEGLRLATIIAKIADSLREQRPEYMEEPENSLYDKLLTRTNNLSEAIRKVFSVDQRETYVYYLERGTKNGRRGSNLEVNATPLDVNSLLSEQLFNESKVICTSATLATVGPNPVNPEDRGPNFAYFRSRVGLDHEKYPDVLEHILPYTFDYENNALLYIPRHLPEPVYGPDTQYYTNKIAEEMMNLVEASQGRAFLLFSSKRMLDAVYNIFLDNLPTYLDFRLLRQGEMNRIELVQEFRASESAILFGLKSFWEGVDIAGDSLSLVVIDKLPFDPPDDPVHEARVAMMKANKENWFGNYVLPQAVLRLKQGLGRLLRTHEDRGVLAILDTRLHTKSYGKLVINALPPAHRTEQLRHVENFFEANEDPPF
ncbi:MAG: helicase C-terminal domain-containing protein, partial [Ktedonobacteraceae bacterium]